MELNSAQQFGDMVRKVRKGLNLTQSQVAGASGTGVRFIVDLERGKPTCELDKALRIAHLLGIGIETTKIPIDLERSE
jgi:y4mF family transcriptional regulator